jgi:hypothetical protein
MKSVQAYEFYSLHAFIHWYSIDRIQPNTRANPEQTPGSLSGSALGSIKIFWVRYGFALGSPWVRSGLPLGPALANPTFTF